MPSPPIHCLNGTAHCTCEVSIQTQVCCYCRKSLPPLHAGILEATPPYSKAYMAAQQAAQSDAQLRNPFLFGYANVPVARAATEKEAEIMKAAKRSLKRAEEDAEMTMLAALLAYNPETTTLDEMVGLLAYGNLLTQTYAANDLEIPGRVVEIIASLTTRIAALATDNREKALREIEQEEERLKTNTERKADLADRKEKLLAKLGRGPKA